MGSDDSNWQPRETRYDFPATIEYHIENTTAEESFKAVTVNISSSGLGAYLFSDHPEGQRIIIKSHLPVAARRAVIRRIKKEGENTYFAGLSFIRHVTNA